MIINLHELKHDEKIMSNLEAGPNIIIGLVKLSSHTQFSW